MPRTKQKSEFVSGLGSAFEFVKAIMGKSKTATKPSVTTPTTAIVDLIPKGWKVVEDVAPSTFKVSDLKFKSFLEGNESYVDGKTMCQCAVAMKGNLGLVDGQYLLEHQAEIPVDLRGKYIVQPGTRLRDSDGYLNVPFLYWDDDRWLLLFYWLDDDWDDFFRLACRE